MKEAKINAKIKKYTRFGLPFEPDDDSSEPVYRIEDYEQPNNCIDHAMQKLYSELQNYFSDVEDGEGYIGYVDQAQNDVAAKHHTIPEEKQEAREPEQQNIEQERVPPEVDYDFNEYDTEERLQSNLETQVDATSETPAYKRVTQDYSESDLQANPVEELLKNPDRLEEFFLPDGEIDNDKLIAEVEKYFYGDQQLESAPGMITPGTSPHNEQDDNITSDDSSEAIIPPDFSMDLTNGDTDFCDEDTQELPTPDFLDE